MRTFSGLPNRTRLDCGMGAGAVKHSATLKAPDCATIFRDNPDRSAVRVQIGNKIYDTASGTSLAGHRTRSGHQELFRTTEGDFFLSIHQIYVDGNKLGPHDIWVDLRTTRTPNSRLQCRQGIRPLQRHEALEWCIKTQIPETFRGLLLEST
jgi:hypothetical protein